MYHPYSLLKEPFLIVMAPQLDLLLIPEQFALFSELFALDIALFSNPYEIAPNFLLVLPLNISSDTLVLQRAGSKQPRMNNLCNLTGFCILLFERLPEEYLV